MTRTSSVVSRQIVRAALLALAVVPLLTATEARPLAAQEDAAALLAQSAETMADLDSFHFELTTPRGQTLFMENLELAGLEGDVARPDRFRATATAKAAIIEVSVDVVGIGTRLWVTDPTAEEERYVELDAAAAAGADGAALTDLLNPDRVLLEAVALIDAPAIGGEDEIDGEETTRIDGTVDLSRIASMATPVPGLRTDQPFPISVWIDAEGRVRRLEMDGPLTTAESPDVVRRLDLSAFDEPVAIEPPV